MKAQHANQKFVLCRSILNLIISKNEKGEPIISFHQIEKKTVKILYTHGHLYKEK